MSRAWAPSVLASPCGGHALAGLAASHRLPRAHTGSSVLGMRSGDRTGQSDNAVAFENPIAGPFESEAMAAAKNVSLAAASRSSGDDVVLPESLDAQQASQQYEVWRESLVEHLADRKENARDRARREAQTQLEDSGILDPDGRFRRHWDVAQMALLTYVAFGVPYRLGFSHPVLMFTSWFFFDMIVDLYFITDIFISCVTAYYDDTGMIVVDDKKIRRKYLRTWAVIDI
eukprot:COSAG02_NODE_13115_length_1444_cov_2.335316_1_plen_229_part_01